MSRALHLSLTSLRADASLRRRVGPTAWCVLEVLLADATDQDATLSATASVRAVAAELGIAKNTAQRAIVRLHRAGLVASTQGRDPAGHFAATTYVLTLTSANRASESSTNSPRRAPALLARDITPSRSSCPQQLSLLPSD